MPWRSFSTSALLFLLCSRALAFWQSDSIKNEPVLFVSDPHTNRVCAALLFAPTGDVSLASGTLEESYVAGRDFVVDAGRRALCLPAGSRIRAWLPSDFLIEHAGPGALGKHKSDARHDLKVDAGRFFHDAQLNASYRHAIETPFPGVQRGADESLPHTIAALAAGQALRIVVLGDSISAGMGSSASMSVAPRQSAYPDLVATGLRERFGATVVLRNLSVSGATAEWGVGQIPAAIAEHPALVVIAFGMNDASAGVPPATFIARLERMASGLRRKMPEVEIIFVSSLLSHPDWAYGRRGLLVRYDRAMGALGRPDAAVAHVTPLWAEIERRKSALALTANGVNHPNDFGHRVYADAILELIKPRGEPLARRSAAGGETRAPETAARSNGTSPNKRR